MAKQQSLKEIRDYYKQPRTLVEFDTDYRSDCDYFEPSMTKQADAQSADINWIMARYSETGQLPQMIQGDPQYGDFSDVGSFQEALDIVRHAQEQFAALPAKIRAKFENDPSKMLEFVNDPANQSQLHELGLAVKDDAITEPVVQAPAAAKVKRQSPPPAPQSE